MRGSCGVVRWILVSQFRVLRTGTLFEIRNDNLQVTVSGQFKNDTINIEMALELIPVIEIGYHHPGISAPDKYPYWEYPELWDKFNSECFKKAGFIDDFKPYLPGSSFYRLTDLTDNNLTKITIDYTKDLRGGNCNREQVGAFSGGYVLRIDGQDKYFPQCCGDLADIKYWENIANGNERVCYAGHPEPKIKIQKNKITFDFTVDEEDEYFVPTPAENIIHFEISSLKKEIETVKKELEAFEQRLEKINQNEQLNIYNIGELLINNDSNYE